MSKVYDFLNVANTKFKKDFGVVFNRVQDVQKKAQKLGHSRLSDFEKEYKFKREDVAKDVLRKGVGMFVAPVTTPMKMGYKMGKKMGMGISKGLQKKKRVASAE